MIAINNIPNFFTFLSKFSKFLSNLIFNCLAFLGSLQGQFLENFPKFDQVNKWGMLLIFINVWNAKSWLTPNEMILSVCSLCFIFYHWVFIPSIMDKCLLCCFIPIYVGARILFYTYYCAQIGPVCISMWARVFFRNLN